MLKRVIDILAASVVLAVSLPMLAIAGILIRISSPGPAIFRQARMGRRFRRFRLYKLRTMNLDVGGPAYTLGADPRITPIGRWLRRFKIDELPQLWNVLRGEMSIVGPRPVIPELAMEFAEAYGKLLAVRPGLTDPASLKYCHETEMLSRMADPFTCFKTVVTPDKIRISQDYLERATLWSDAVVVIRTILALATPFSPRRPAHRRPVVEVSAPAMIDLPGVVNGRTARPRLSRSGVMVQFHSPHEVAEGPGLPPAVRGGDSLKI